MRADLCIQCETLKRSFPPRSKTCTSCCDANDKATLAQNYSPVFSRALRNAEKRGIPFEITIDQFYRMVTKAKGCCQISGLPFKFPRNQKGRRNPFGPSLDRINSRKGYVQGNCRIVSILANCALNEWGEEPLRKFCEAVVNRSNFKSSQPNANQLISEIV